jgi:glucose/arabinose dehydrogenase
MKKNMKSFVLNMHAASALLVLFLCFWLLSCDDWFDDDDDVGEFYGDVYADHLDTPWELAFSPDGRLFFTQRPGVVSVIENGDTKVWLNLDSTVAEIGESGLLGIALHPDFSQNGYVYIGYTYAASKYPLKLINKLVRYKEDPATQQPLFDRVIMDDIEGNYVHNSGPLEFSPDGKLFWAIGEQFSPDLAQDMNVLNGKILRMNDDGSLPADNPFPGSYIYSLGHRNPQGLAFHPESGALWSTEHGPSEEQGCCNDEINLIKPAANYGWPIIRGSETQAGLETPVYNTGDTTTWAPAGGVFITDGDWKGSLVFTGLRGEALYRAVFDNSDATKIQTVERYLHQKFGRLRNVIEGPDGKLYLAVSNQDGRGDPITEDDRIIIFSQDDLKKLK